MPRKTTTAPEELIDYDAPWKNASGDLSFHLVRKVIPEMYAQLDLSVPPVAIEQALRARLKGKHPKALDKVLLFTLLNGEKRGILLHIEFESHPRAGTLGFRMFQYFSLLLAQQQEKPRKRRANEPEPPTLPYDITTLVIYVGNDIPTVYDRFEYEAFGTQLVYKFNTFCVRMQDEAELLADPNPICIIILANLYTLDTIGDPERRLALKEQVYALAHQRGESPETIAALLVFIEDIMKLPEDYETAFQTYSSNYYTEQDMSTAPRPSLRLTDTLTQKFFGTTIAEQAAALSQQAAALSQKDAALSQKDAALSQQAAALEKTIIRLFSLKKMAAAEIADVMEQDAAFVTEVLTRNNLMA